MKNFIIGFGIALVSFTIWSLILPKALAYFDKQNNILGVENVASPQPTPTVFYSPTSTPSIYPSITSSIVPKPKSTPKPSSSSKPTSSPIPMSQLDEWFTKYANKESINRELLKKIGACESEFNPNAVNGPYGGLYQFTIKTWISTRTKMNLNTDPDLRFDPEEAIKTAAFRLATQGAGAWPNCGK